MSKIPQKNNSRRGEGVQFLFAFEMSWKPVSNHLPTSPGVLPPVNRQVYSRAVLSGMPNICFICRKKRLLIFLSLLHSELLGRGSLSHLCIFSIAEVSVGHRE